MASSFFFYDLETSGFSAHNARIMQFAGQRTDMELNPIGDPVNILIKITDEILPDPDAILITGITPQMTLQDGVTEAEFLRIFNQEVATQGTIFAGYNTVRFDDEFMRVLHYRNFYDPYEWQWKDERSRWDLLDVVRMTRALRPDGIEWPFDVHGKPTNRLELITGLNKLSHAHAHDALSDVIATIEVAKLIRSKNAKLFDYLLNARHKKAVAELVNKNEPFIYTSGRYSSDYEKTTPVVKITDNARKGGAFVYNLRYDPSQYLSMTPEQLVELWRWKKDTHEQDRLPVKVLPFNKCPAVAPLGVLDDHSQVRLKISLNTIRQNYSKLKASPEFADKILRASEILEKQQQTRLISTDKDADQSIYDGFLGEQDKQALGVVRAAKPEELSSLNLEFQDGRLGTLLPLYKARNYPKSLTPEERIEWEAFRRRKLFGTGQSGPMVAFLKRLQDIMGAGNLTGHQQYILEELKLYAESIMPEADDA
jgi:exodeoxyribonuclease I